MSVGLVILAIILAIWPIAKLLKMQLFYGLLTNGGNIFKQFSG
jgi:hypothetical protein